MINQSFILLPDGAKHMLSLLESDDYNQRVKELAYQKLASAYGISREQANEMLK